MAVNVLTGELVDPFHGKEDLNRKVLRHSTEAFSEDPLRVYRVARFAAKFGFSIDSSTKALMRALKPELQHLKAERVWKETEKALKADFPHRFFEVLREVGVLDVHFPELNALDVPDKHDGTAFSHTMRVISSIGGQFLKYRFGLLTHDFGKALTDPSKHPSHYDHDKLGEKPVKEFCRRLRVPKKLEKFGVLCASEHMRAKRLLKMRPGKALRWVLKHKKDVGDLLFVTFLDSACRQGANMKKERAWHLSATDLINRVLDVEEKITGKSLLEEGRVPGKEFGELLFQRRVEAFVKQKR